MIYWKTEKNIDKLTGTVGTNRNENHYAISRPILTTICSDFELQEVDIKLINNELPEFHAQFVSLHKYLFTILFIV